ncbi:hypothetical protein QBC37DRAFT_456434 [Rhypophila decipiens]|uniref:ANK_REP_REGION domain-containing protein n=1 Tax=Rhypophila decipiens TaxID=261697 RepID=A0AAN6XWW8_9PEZI|nr:hypothetical protein QBC37DRAFT_456434 [Rhypophila decipiens]
MTYSLCRTVFLAIWRSGGSPRLLLTAGGALFKNGSTCSKELFRTVYLFAQSPRYQTCYPECARTCQQFMELSRGEDDENRPNSTPIHQVLFSRQHNGRLSALQDAISANPECLDRLDDLLHSSPLHFAVHLNDLPATRMLLAAGADVNVRSGHGGYTALHLTSMLRDE